MKLVTFERDGQVRVGEWDAAQNTVCPLAFADGEPVYSMLGLIQASVAGEVVVAGDAQSLDDARLLAPLPRPERNIFCVGKNYHAHAEEFARSGFDAGRQINDAIPAAPIVFTKAPETVIAHGETIWAAEGVTDALDYEAELAVIIGQGGRGIARADAMKHVFGYTIINDVTARDWQKRHQQWFLGKSFDTFAPMGPALVTADEVDGAILELRCHVNGELRQHANTRDMIFDIPTLIEILSAGITLYPGDIIATGTPEGVGIGFQPPRFLRRGDRVRIEIQGIGVLENTIG
ncbi:fumarylacetoacetate hydrolase family protein [Dyella sp.]|uniref:fumarylacetoacetate hydrolase family protein n=1 Tax=Dyella sp. TaxID=1869338 RepID=UPI002ED35A7D